MICKLYLSEVVRNQTGLTKPSCISEIMNRQDWSETKKELNRKENSPQDNEMKRNIVLGTTEI